MLYRQGGSSGQKNCRIASWCLLAAIVLLMACNQSNKTTDIAVLMSNIQEMRADEMTIDEQQIRRHIADMGTPSKDSMSISSFALRYYRDGGTLLWIDRLGVRPQADTLINRLHRLSALGFSERAFHLQQIENDVECLRQLNFNGERNINRTIAQLEYRLTRAYLRLVVGQRFGFVNPRTAYVFDAAKTDTSGVSVSRPTLLYDLPVEHVSSGYYHQAFQRVLADSVGEMIDQSEPQDAYYLSLKKQLSEATGAQRKLLMVNMERCRWRKAHHAHCDGKQIVVNLPAYQLYAYDQGHCLAMRIGCGKDETRTPLLSSEITFFQVNPEWTIPTSIINKDVAHHAGDSAYFAHHRYYMADRATGKQIDVRHVSRGMLLSGKYRVTQKGGPGNSMGRLVFRFKNNFSVYLHDTSSPGFFSRAQRKVSHGCVRVQKPFELAQYLLGETDDWALDRIRISIDMPPETQRGQNYVRNNPRPEDGVYRLASYMPVKPAVPLFIVYYTIYLDETGTLQTYPDIYAYDEAIWKHLQYVL